MGSHAAEPGDQGCPATGQSSQVQPVRRVGGQVEQVHQGGFGGVVHRQVQVADLGSQDGLGARRQGGVPDGERLVVVEVAAFLLGGERVTAQVHGQHEIGLLHHLLAVEVEVGDVQQQRVRVGRQALEVQSRVHGEVLGLL